MINSVSYFRGSFLLMFIPVRLFAFAFLLTVSPLSRGQDIPAAKADAKPVESTAKNTPKKPVNQKPANKPGTATKASTGTATPAKSASTPAPASPAQRPINLNQAPAQKPSGSNPDNGNPPSLGDNQKPKKPQI
jgi:hypothetical protein